VTRLLVACCLVLAGSVAGSPARGQDTAPPTTAPTTITTVPPGTEESVGFESPRSAMRGFLWAGRDGDWQAAAKYLDLRGRDAKDGPRLARALKTVLDRKLWVDLDALSDEPEGDPNDKQPRDRDAAGAFQLANGDWARILLERVPAADGTRQWKIARSTVQQIDRMWRDFGDGPLSARLPEPFFDIRFLDVQLWQWIALFLLLLGSVLLAWLLTAPLLRLARAIAHRTSTPVDDVLADLIVGPIRLAVGTAVFLFGVYPLWLPLRAQRFVVAVATGLITIAFTWFVLRLIDAMSRVMLQRYLARGQLAATSVVPLARRALKVFAAVVAMLAVVQNLGFNVTGILAGLGIGGLAVALAAQKSIENLFGGLSLIADQPVRVGDMCKFGSQQGTVEDIGLRSTRVRTLDRTVVTIPNADFATMAIENFGTRDRFRLATTIAVRYETTPDQLRWLLVELKKMLLAHPKVSPDPARVRFSNFGASSLDIELFAYIKTRDADEFMAVREDLFLRIMDLVVASGTDFAVPTQLSYGPGDKAVDLERRKAVEAEVAAWRDANTLPLPYVPRERAQELADSLDWPPAGSSGLPAKKP
jgi:MscS family membrane protein